jgi:hypothetical protein
MKRAPFLLPFLLFACASKPLTEAGSRVKVVPALSPADAAKYIDLGDIVTSEPAEFGGDEEDARYMLLNSAARKGAAVLVMKQSGRSPCVVNTATRCVFLESRGYR